MLKEALTVSALILAVLLVRAMFRSRVPKRMIYCLWLVVLLKLCLPVTLFSLPLLPVEAAAAPVQRAEAPVQTAPVVQQPAQTAAQPQPPAQQPASPVQKSGEPAEKPLTTAQVFQVVRLGGSALLGLWLSGAWTVFTIRLRRNRRLLGRRGRTRIYVSDAVRSPCLAGLIPAVYLTQNVLQTDEAELILRHELTHLRHLDFLWSFCRTLAVIVYWWNPFIWLAAICSARDAELACDEAVAAGLSDAERLAYARAILAQAPRRAAALSLAGPPVKERILFLTKKQRTSALCVILALLLVASAAGCSFAELTRQKSGEITMPDAAAHPEAVPDGAESATNSTGTVESAPLPDDRDGDSMIALPAEAAAWAGTYLSARYTVLDCQTAAFDGTDYLLLLTGSKDVNGSDYTGYQIFALEKTDGGCSLYAWNEAQAWDSSRGLLACAMRTDELAAVYGFTDGGTQFDTITTVFADGTEETGAIAPDAPFLRVFTGRLLRVQDVVFSGGGSEIKWSEVSAAGLHAPVEDDYPPNDSIGARIRMKLDFAHWAREMTPEYEEAVRQFQLADSKMSDLPGDVSQWPRYYSAFAGYFSGMNADLHYLDADAVWTEDLSVDGQELIVTMSRGGRVLTLAYLPETRTIRGGVDYAQMSMDMLALLQDELYGFRPDNTEAEKEKWAAIAAIKNEMVTRAKAEGYHYEKHVTFDDLNEMIDYRLMNNEILMNAFPDDAVQMEACRTENAAIEAFRATLPENGDDADAYSYWQYYWNEVLHQEPPSYYVP